MESSRPSGAHLPFHEAADRVSRRLAFCHWFSAMRATALPAMVIGLAVFATLRILAYRWSDGIAALILVAGWIAACGIWARWRRPPAFAALAAWDESAGRKEKFASAYFFEAKKHLLDSEELHVGKSRAELGSALKCLPSDLRLPVLGWRALLPVLLLAFTFSPLLKPRVEAGDALLAGEMLEKAVEEGEKLKARENEFDKMAALSKEEKENIEKLRREIDETADRLGTSGDKTAREVLSELEERARAAEKLAERLGSRGDEWASEEMLQEMRRHADTADLADAIKDRKAERSAEQSEAISKKLRDPELSNETDERVETALSRVMKKATAEDHKRPVGENVGKASVNMGKDKPVKAAEDFKRLARHFRRLEEREKAQEKLRKIAEELRKAGSNIASKNLQSMKKLAGNQGKNMQGKGKNSLQNNPNLSPLNQQNLPNLGQGKMLPIPGLKPGKPGSGKPLALAPVPGGLKGNPKAMAFVPGSPGNKPPKFVVPIPGTGSGQPMGMMPGGGGLQAGQGSAPMDKNAVNPMNAPRSGLVTAQTGSEGDSAMRAVEGGERTEIAERGREEQVVEFIKVEEEALDELALPLSRKEHVLRYFTALRERFEEE